MRVMQGSVLTDCLCLQAVRYSPYALFIVRVGQGLLQAPFYSACFAMWSHWAPPAERSRLSAQAQIGGYSGTLIFGALSGWQCDRAFTSSLWRFLGLVSDRMLAIAEPELPLIGGWEGVFYLHGVMGVIWFLLWNRIAQERPATAHRCSAAERAYIEDALLVELEVSTQAIRFCL